MKASNTDEHPVKMSLSLFSVPCGLQCMSVRILNEEPIYVIPGSRLDLQAQIEHGPQEEVSMVTWERMTETGRNPQRETLATCPGKSVKCAGTGPGVSVNVEQQETTLQISKYSRADSNVFTVTVTDGKGAKTTAQCIVREYGGSMICSM